MCSFSFLVMLRPFQPSTSLLCLSLALAYSAFAKLALPQPGVSSLCLHLVYSISWMETPMISAYAFISSSLIGAKVNSTRPCPSTTVDRHMLSPDGM